MDLDLSLVKKMFDGLPEAVFLLEGSTLLYTNPRGRALLPKDAEARHPLLDLLPEESGELVCTIQDALVHLSISPLDNKRLLIARSLRESMAPPLTAKIPAQLRLHLSSLSATTEQLATQLSRGNALAPYRDLLCIQAQATCRILRLTRQLELSDGDLDTDYPHRALDFVALCRNLSEELLSRSGGLGAQFRFHTELPSLILAGSPALLEQLILSLLSNALKSATQGGEIEMTLSLAKERALLSIWNNGGSIPEDRLSQLFSPESGANLPQPGEGTGLDLWLTHRIALAHGGVIMASNRPEGGATFTVSLPITPPGSLQLQSSDAHILREEGFSPLLIALSDALPARLFHPLEL